MRRALAVCLLLAVAACTGGDSRLPLPLRRVEDIPLPGSTGRFDYVSFDASRHLLAIAHLSDSTVLGFDTAARRLVWQTHGVASVHGVRVAPELGRVFASATGTNEVVALDETTGAVLARASTGRFPDGLAYDPGSQTVFVSNKDDGTETVVDARTLAAVRDVAVGDNVGNVQFDNADATMLVAVGSTNDLVTIDPTALRVVRHTRLPGCRGAHGLAIDPLSHRAFIACEDNATVVSVDLEKGAVTARQATGGTPDVLALDTALERLYVAAEDGTVGTYSTARGSLRTAGSAHVASGAHTVAVDGTNHVVYLPLPNVDGDAVLRVMTPTG